MTRGGLRLAVALLLVTTPLDARADEASGDETVVIQDASGRIVVVPGKAPPARAPERGTPVPPAAAAARDGRNPCVEHEYLVDQWLSARGQVVRAQRALEAAESIPLSGMGHYRAARIAAAERRLEKAEAREMEIDSRAADLRVPQSCFDDSGLDASDD